jgi:hypothetical protein
MDKRGKLGAIGMGIRAETSSEHCKSVCQKDPSEKDDGQSAEGYLEASHQPASKGEVMSFWIYGICGQIVMAVPK